MSSLIRSAVSFLFIY